MDAKEQPQTTNLWDNEQLLAELVQRASAHGDRLVKVLFEASLQTLTDEQADQDYRERVVEALAATSEKPETSEPQETPEAANIETDTDVTPEDQSQTPAKKPVISSIVIPTLQAPKLVSLCEKTPTPEVLQDDKPVEFSRENAILHEEARRELLRPLLAFAACVVLLVALGLGWISRSGILGLPQAAYAKTAKPVPAQTTNQNPSWKPSEVEQPIARGD